MGFLGKLKKKIENNEDLSELLSSSFKDFLNGNILKKEFVKKQYPLLFLIAILSFIYIGNRMTVENQVKYISNLRRELKDVKYESLTVSTELTELSRRSYVLGYIESKNLGLKESNTAPVIIQNKK